MIAVQRDAAEVFDHPRSMAGFEGAPVTLQHPDVPVQPYSEGFKPRQRKEPAFAGHRTSSSSLGCQVLVKNGSSGL